MGSISVKGGGAISDTGTSLLAGPTKAVSALAAGVGAYAYKPYDGVPPTLLTLSSLTRFVAVRDPLQCDASRRGNPLGR